MYKTLFVTSRSAVHQAQAVAAAPSQLDVTVMRDPDRVELLAALADAEFLMSERAGAVDRQMIEAGSRLRLIQRLGSQTFDIDLAAAVERQIPVCYWPLPGAIAVAEHMVWQTLALLRRSHEVEDPTPRPRQSEAPAVARAHAAAVVREPGPYLLD